MHRMCLGKCFASKHMIYSVDLRKNGLWARKKERRVEKRKKDGKEKEKGKAVRKWKMRKREVPRQLWKKLTLETSGKTFSAILRAIAGNLTNKQINASFSIDNAQQ